MILPQWLLTDLTDIHFGEQIAINSTEKQISCNFYVLLSFDCWMFAGSCSHGPRNTHFVMLWRNMNVFFTSRINCDFLLVSLPWPMHLICDKLRRMHCLAEKSNNVDFFRKVKQQTNTSLILFFFALLFFPQRNIKFSNNSSSLPTKSWIVSVCSWSLSTLEMNRGSQRSIYKTCPKQTLPNERSRILQLRNFNGKIKWENMTQSHRPHPARVTKQGVTEPFSQPDVVH